ncbi:uncharacterized protein [Coffea arabica]|uniref:Uncharacterized protein isoform X1 n=1 Tax=Coffea arabica TaxID=13443 RepID=A0ABM4WZT7_COFAR|nr:leucine-rich repeat extensin-like protein 1 isoform X1 [Coffea arabica]XP_027115252.1 leucine-rich repeat extensin-like protein 1 isoform X1 [Coffea arabica]
MAMQAKMEKMEMRQQYRNHWHTDLLNATAADPVFCCFAFFCGPCASYMLRKRALYNDMSRYTCCGGYMPCSGHCGESTCPEFCLCTEVSLCFANSVASTRFMLQDEFDIQTTKCDNCIIGFMFCLQQLACICSLIACIVGSEEIEDAAQMLNCLADMVYCSVCPCMQTQHKTEMDKRDGKFGSAAAATMAVPPVQQMSRIDHSLPPSVGYLPPPAYSYPPHQQPQGAYPPPHYNYYPPPPHFHGYPPPTQGYYPPPQPYGYFPPQPYGYSPPPQQAPGSPPDLQSHVYPPPPPQNQGSSPVSHTEGYTQPPQQAQATTPSSEISPSQAQGPSPPVQSHEHPQAPPEQSHSPAGAAHPPPSHRV